MVYVLSCKICHKIFVGSTITSFRKCFNKGSAFRYGNGQKGLAPEQLYAHFLSQITMELMICVKIIDKTDINEPTRKDAFWAHKLNSFNPQGLNQRNLF